MVWGEVGWVELSLDGMGWDGVGWRLLHLSTKDGRRL